MSIPVASTAAAQVATVTTTGLGPPNASNTFATTSTIRPSVGPIRPYPSRNTPNAVDSRYTLIDMTRYATTPASATLMGT